MPSYHNDPFAIIRRKLRGTASSIGIAVPPTLPETPTDTPSISLADSIFSPPTLVNPYENGTATRFKPGRGALAAPGATNFYAPTTVPMNCDVLVNLSNQNGGRTANMEVRSGRNIRVCGGDLSPGDGQVSTFQNGYGNPCPSIVLEGIYWNGQLGNPCDALGFSGYREIDKKQEVYVLNCHLRGVHGYNAGTHGDGIQIRDLDLGGTGTRKAGISKLAIMNVTVYSKYQGIIEGLHHANGGTDVSYKKNVDIHYDDSWTAAIEDADTVLWYAADPDPYVENSRINVSKCHEQTFRIFRRPGKAVDNSFRPRFTTIMGGQTAIITAFPISGSTMSAYSCVHPSSRWEGFVVTGEQGVTPESDAAFNYEPGDKAAGNAGPAYGTGHTDYLGDPLFTRPPGYNAITDAAQLGAQPVEFTATTAPTAGMALGSVLGYLSVKDAPRGLVLDTPNIVGSQFQWVGGELTVNDWLLAGTYPLTYDVVDRFSGVSKPMSITLNVTGTAVFDPSKLANKHYALDPEAVTVDGSGNVAVTWGSTYSLVGAGTISGKPTLVAGGGPDGQDMVTFVRANQQFFDASNLVAVGVNEFEFNAVMRWNSQNASSSSTTHHPLFGNATASSTVALGRTSGSAADFTHVFVGTNTLGVTTPFALDVPIVTGQWYEVRATMDANGYFRFFLDGVERARGQIGSGQQTFSVRRLFASSTTVTSDVSVVFAQLCTKAASTNMSQEIMNYTANRNP